MRRNILQTSRELYDEDQSKWIDAIEYTTKAKLTTEAEYNKAISETQLLMANSKIVDIEEFELYIENLMIDGIYLGFSTEDLDSYYSIVMRCIKEKADKEYVESYSYADSINHTTILSDLAESIIKELEKLKVVKISYLDTLENHD